MGIQFSEYVTLGHPDKIADYISQCLLDEYIRQDPLTRYAVEVQVKDNIVTLGGEVSSKADINKDRKVTIVKDAIRSIGYNSNYSKIWGDNAINADKVTVHIHISEQSGDIAQGLNGWGDQGIFFGYYNTEHDGFTFEHHTAKRLGNAIMKLQGVGLDIKTQIVTNNGKIVKTIIAVPLLKDEADVVLLARSIVGDDCELIVNGTGRYVKHSSIADCGTTGRKLVVDFYGGGSRIGGGSPWTKDGSKADLTLNIYARELAKEWSELLHKEIHTSIASCIGHDEVDINIEDGEGNVIKSYSERVSPQELITRYELNKPIYAELCREGLFSRIK